MTILLAALYIVICLLIGWLGRDRRMGFFGTFAVSLVITPVVVLLLLALTGPSSTVEWRRKPPPPRLPADPRP